MASASLATEKMVMGVADQQKCFAPDQLTGFLIQLEIVSTASLSMLM
jgi:hypothetical protein